MKKRIADVYINQSEADGSIYGLRIVDDKGENMIDQHWFNKAGQQGTAWKHFKIPQGKEIIGMHLSHDGSWFKSLGLILWRPNPNAKRDIAVRDSVAIS